MSQLFISIHSESMFVYLSNRFLLIIGLTPDTHIFESQLVFFLLLFGLLFKCFKFLLNCLYLANCHFIFNETFEFDLL